MNNKRSVWALFFFISMSYAGIAHAHGPVARVSEASDFEARLFTADAATGEVVAIDLPSGKVISRLPTPPFIMQLGLSQDQRYLYAMRGRSTDRDFVTIIDTGINPSDPLARPPYIARTLTANTPGGIRGGQVASVGGRDAIFMEGSAEIVVMNAASFTEMSDSEPTRYRLANPDHYHYLESGNYLYVGHLRSSMIQILDRTTGEEVGQIGGCPVVHGMARDDETGRLLFGCRTHVVIIGTRGDETNRELGRITYPTKQRAAAFQRGRDRVFWAYTEGTLPVLYRLDLKADPWSFDVLPVPRSIQQKVTDDGNYLLVLTRAGELQIHDGASGDLLSKVLVSGPVEDALHEHVDKAILPGIETLAGMAYVSLPHAGQIVVVDIESGVVTNTFATGGEPTRLVAVAKSARSMLVDEVEADLENRWYTANDLVIGKQVYKLNCATCHGDRAQGNYGNGNVGKAPAAAPPPLDGSGHSSSHSLDEMLGVINAGVDAAMPPFGSLLNNEEKRGVVAYYQSLWTDAVYSKWQAGPGRELRNMPSGDSHEHRPGGHEQSHGQGDHNHGDGQHRHSQTVTQR